MTYDQWKTTDPRELLPYDEEGPTELDLVYEQLHQAEATISRLTAERDALQARVQALQGGAERYWEGRYRDAVKAMAELLSGHDNLYRAQFPGCDPRDDIAAKAVRSLLATPAVSDAVTGGGE